MSDYHAVRVVAPRFASPDRVAARFLEDGSPWLDNNLGGQRLRALL